MKITILIFISLVVLVVIFFVALQYWIFKTPNIKTPPNASREEKLDAINQWFDALERQGKFNGTILYAQNGTPVVQRNFGNTDAQGQRQISDRTSFNLASVTKHFTAFGLLLLAYEKKIDFEDSIAKYISELNAFKDVTVRQLLEHTSGIPEYAYLNPKDLLGQEFFDIDFLLSWLNLEANVSDFKPGTKYAYTNTNYVLLSEIIARISGKSYAQFMNDRIFEPLEMRDSAVVNQIVNVDVLHDRAYGFRRKRFHFGSLVDYDLTHLDGIAGDGNIYASAGDLLTWNTALREGQLLPKKYTDRLYQPIMLDNVEVIEESFWSDKYTFGFGGGWKNADRSRFYAYGGWQGFLHSTVWNLDNGDILIVLSNASFGLGTFSIFDKLEEWARNFNQ